MKILVTAGATCEALDSVRYFSNVSSGRTGVSLSNRLAQSGFSVLCLAGRNVPQDWLESSVELMRFKDTEDLRDKLKNLLSEQHFDGVIHAAAVSDYRPFQVTVNNQKHELPLNQKLSSDADEMTVHFKRNPKLIDFFIQWTRNKNLVIVGFKLTHDLSQDEQKKAVQQLMRTSCANFVVHNDLSHVNESQHQFQIYSRTGVRSQGSNNEELFEQVKNLFERSFV